MSEREQPQDEAGQPVEIVLARPPAETAAPLVLAVGHIVRLPSGEHVEVHGVRRSPDGVQIMRAGGEWLDADGIVVSQG